MVQFEYEYKGGLVLKIRPQKLQQGDTVGLITVSSPLKPESLGLKIEVLEQLGLKVKLGNTITLQQNYLAGSDAERLADFHTMLKDPEVKAIFFACGGYGVARLLDKLSYGLMEDNAKILWGFSDITPLHIVANEYSNLVTFHGPMLSHGSKELDELSLKMFQQLFTPIEIQYGEHISPLTTIAGGAVRGELTGGNLNRIVATFGTKFEIDVRNKILLLEDVGESVQNIDHMMNQLRLSRKLEQAAGFVIGSFTKLPEGDTEDDVLHVMTEYLSHLGKPVIAGFKIGHCEPNIAIPLGVDAILDADAKSLRILPGIE